MEKYCFVTLLLILLIGGYFFVEILNEGDIQAKQVKLEMLNDK
jgi:hypothetical protein